CWSSCCTGQTSPSSLFTDTLLSLGRRAASTLLLPCCRRATVLASHLRCCSCDIINQPYRMRQSFLIVGLLQSLCSALTISDLSTLAISDLQHDSCSKLNGSCVNNDQKCPGLDLGIR
ncbi:unnamed protein product, partial [Meganyctiphanes norvegica]